MRTVLNRHPSVKGRTAFDSIAGDIASLAAGYGPASRLVGINLVGTRRMAVMNRAYKGRRGSAEILTFDYGDDADSVPGADDPSGEIYICWTKLAASAGRLGVAESDYALRLIAHGLCHLEGYSHPDEASAGKMEKAEKSRLEGLVPASSLRRMFGDGGGER